MKREVMLLVLVLVVIAFWTLFAFETSRVAEKAAAKQSMIYDAEINRINDADRFVDRVVYYKDSRTGLCFAVYGAPPYSSEKFSMVVVPEANIPPSLLRVSSSPPKNAQ